MKYLFFPLTACLLSVNCFSQTKTSIYSEGVCDCMDSAGGVQKSMIDCFRKSVERNKSWFEQSVREHGDTSESGVSELIDKLLFDVQIDLIGSCKSFFIYSDSLDRLRYKNLNRDSLKRVLVSLDNIDATKRDRNYYMVKADLYVKLEQYGRASEITDSLLSRDSSDEVGLVLKAIVLDRKGDYMHSVQLYNKLVQTTKKDGYRLFAALAERRSSEARKVESQ